MITSLSLSGKQELKHFSLVLFWNAFVKQERHEGEGIFIMNTTLLNKNEICHVYNSNKFKNNHS